MKFGEVAGGLVRPMVSNWQRRPRKPVVACFMAASLLLITAVGGCSAPGKGAATPRAQETEVPGNQNSPTYVAMTLAKILGVNTPQWTGKILAGPSCGQRRNVFCPIAVASTPDGKFIALADSAGRLEVVRTATERVILNTTLHMPSGKLGTAWVDVSISANGQLASRDLTVISPSGDESTIGFGVWNVATGKELVTNGPTVKSPWGPISNIAFGPDNSMLLAVDEETPQSRWLVASVHNGTISFLDEYESRVQPDAIMYSASQSAWVAMWDQGYAVWRPGGVVRSISRPECLRVTSETIDTEGRYFACEVNGSSLEGSRLVKVWDIQTGMLYSQISTGRYGVVYGFTFLNDAQSMALTVGTDTSDSTVKSLLVLSLGPRPLPHYVTSLPGVSAGWQLMAMGRFLVALGSSTIGGVCCVAVIGTS